MFLEIYVQDQCDYISPEFELVPDARDLRVDDCQSLTRLLIPAGAEDVRIFGCGNLEILLVACVTPMMALHGLSISNREKLKSLPEHKQELPPFLNELYLTYCPEVAAMLYSKSSYIQTQVRSLLEEGLPPSLSELYLSRCDELRSLPTDALRLLPSLQRLEISSCDKLQSLPESGLPSSLSELMIEDFPNLQSLPVKRMPFSLSRLSVSRYPLLKPLLEFDEGKYWPNIAQIPTIDVDREYL